jgi:hypothetical protein
VVVDREAGRLRLRRPRVSLRPDREAEAGGLVQVPAVGRGVVPGDAALAPAEVVGGRDVGEKREALFVTEVRAGLDEPCRIDDERGLAVRLLALDKTRNAFVGAQVATPRIS